MNRRALLRKPAAWPLIAQLWSLVDRPAKRAYDSLHEHKERLLGSIFLGHNLGRWIYNRTSANWWTDLRFKTCWVPGTFILLGWGIVACVASILIWSTDVIDGWFARTKQQESDEGMRRETTVDAVFKLVTFGAVFIHYPNVRLLMGTAGSLELVRIIGALYLIWNGFKPKPNRSGKFKTWCFVLGIGLLLLFPCTTVDYLIEGGIALSVYSMGMHWLEYQNWRRLHTRPRH